MKTHLNTRRIVIFVAFVIAVSWAVVLLVKQSGIMETNPTAGMLMANYIIITLPALANIFTRLITKEGWKNFWLRPKIKRGWRFYLAAWLLPLLATVVGGGLFFLLFPQSFDPNLGEVRKAFALVPALATQPWLGLLIIFVQIMLMSAIINTIASMGEELGWRAYLLQKLMVLFAGSDGTQRSPNTGARRAALLVGLIWGLWHYPLFFLGGTLAFPFALIYLVYTCSASVLLSWVTLRSSSVWPASLGHGMLNGTSALPAMMQNSTANPLFGPGPTGLVGLLGYLILALVLLFNRRAFSGKEEARHEGVRDVVGAQHA